MEWLSSRGDADAPSLGDTNKKSGLPLVARTVDRFGGTLDGRSAAEMTIMALSFPAVAAPDNDEHAPTDSSRVVTG